MEYKWNHMMVFVVLTCLVVVHPGEEEATRWSHSALGVGPSVPGLQQLPQLGYREPSLAHRHQGSRQPPDLQHKASRLSGNTVLWNNHT
jgi:hypothetical protein